ncbi:MAG: four helix bundle protein [Verrucomicrobiae bacterium]|nr:four helix bundle protein [Verrucomicrobiae bacterium]
MNQDQIEQPLEQRRKKIVRHTDLDVYRRAFAAAMEVFQLSRSFPPEEKYSLTDQIRRASRSVAANITEGWRKRRYPASFINKLNDAEGEAAETQTWLQFAVESHYLTADQTRALYQEYDEIIAMLVHMQNHPEQWSL